MRALLVAIFLVLGAASVFAQAPTSAQIKSMASDSQKSARAGIGVLQKLVTRTTAKRMGFDKADQVRDAQLGPPLADYMIGLNSLRTYRPGQNPESLIQPTGVMHYPVVAAGATRCLITVARHEGEWQAVSYGNPVVARAMAAARSRVGGNPTETFMLRIPALNLTFLAHRVPGKLLLTAALTGGLYGIKEGSTAPAEDVLARLQPEAMRLKDDVPH